MENIIGNRFGNLVVSSYVGREIGIGKNKYKHYYFCKCDCGKEVKVCRSNLIAAHTKSCGCLKHKKGKHNKGWTGHEGISGYFWNKVKRHTVRAGRTLPFEISIEYAWDLFEKQNRCCALSGLPIEMAKGSRNGTWTGTASLDRIDSEFGYIEGNVQWVHKEVNWMKWSLPQTRFIEICKMVVNKHGK